MRRSTLLLSLLGLLIFSSSLLSSETGSGTMAWPQWRGPLGTGVSPDANPPITWSETENVRWKVALPGLGHSTPVVWGKHLFLTAAVAFGDPLPPKRSGVPGAHDNLAVSSRFRFVVLALDRETGKTVWQRTVKEALPHEGGHLSASLASASPVTDGEMIFASFGSQGLYALDFAGKLVWSVDFGLMRTKHAHGEGSSPALFGETLVVNWDHEGPSFVVALNKRTGEEKWRRGRNEVTSWSTPIIIEVEGKPQVIVPGTERVRGYDLETGDLIWQCGGLSANVVATPVADDGMVFLASSYDTRALLAIELTGARGDITGTEKVVWRRTRGTPYVPSPLLYDGSLYFLRHYQGVLSRVIAKTGEDFHPPVRLPGIRNIYASPVGAAGRIYITDREGSTIVLQHAGIGKENQSKILAVNRLDDSFSASAALAGSELYLRGKKALYRLETLPQAARDQPE